MVEYKKNDPANPLERLDKFSFRVLDKGYIRLVAQTALLTESVNEKTELRAANDRMILDAARVSHNNDGSMEELGERDFGLLSFLLRNQHTSPFEHVTLTFEVKAPLFVLRQWHRHRTWNYSELSGRYFNLQEADFYDPHPAWVGKPSDTNKQSRVLDGVPSYLASDSSASYQGVIALAQKAYESILQAGWPKEIARAVLPTAMYSRMYATVSLHNLMHFIRLRIAPDAQWEIQQYARALLELAEEVAPETIQLFRESLEE